MTPVEYNDNDIQKLVNDYNKLNRAQKNPEYWSHEEVNKIREYIKNHYLNQQGNECAYCKQKNLSKNHKVWEIEHIVDKSHYPEYLFTPKNLCVVCPDCNTHKGSKNVLKKNIARYPNSGTNFTIYHPHFDSYSDHIRISGGFLYLGITQKGSNTITICGLYRFTLNYVSRDIIDFGEQADDILDLVSDIIESKDSLAALLPCTLIKKKMEKMIDEIIDGT